MRGFEGLPAPTRVRVGRRLLAAGLFAIAAGWGVACGAFSLNDVTPLSPDAAAKDAASGRDVHASDQLDAPTPTDAVCIPDGSDPCACLSSTQVSTAPGTVAGIAVVDGNVYWLASTTTSNSVVPWRIAASATDAGSGERFEPQFTWNTENQLPILSNLLYFGVIGSADQDKLEEFSLDGGATVVLHDLPYRPFGLRVTDGGIYWTNQFAEICYAGLDGATVPGDSGCGGKPLMSDIYDVDNSNGNDLSLNSTTIFFSVNSIGGIFAVPIEGGLPHLVFTGHAGTRYLLADDHDLVWSEALDGGGALLKRTLGDGGSPIQLAASAPITAVLADDATVYFATAVTTTGTTTTSGRIEKVPRDGGPVTVLACDPFGPSAIAVDEQFLYWGDFLTSGIWKVPK